MYVCMYVCIYAYVYIYIYIHVYMCNHYNCNHTSLGEPSDFQRDSAQVLRQLVVTVAVVAAC